MRHLLSIKILVMVITLFAVIYSIRHLNHGSIQKAFDSMGLQAGGSAAPGFHPSANLAPGEKAFNLCPNRIHAVVWSERRKVEEFRDGLKLKWIAVDPAPREVSYMAIEKWLSAHCQVAVRAIDNKAGAAYDPFVTVRYIDGKELKIEREGDTRFRVSSTPTETFESTDLASALKQLETVAEFKSESKNATNPQ